MVYQTYTMGLRLSGEIISGEKNEVFLCQSVKEQEEDPVRTYLMWQVTDRAVVKYLIEAGDRLPVCECFPHGKWVCLLLPFEERRPLFRFIHVQADNSRRRKEVMKELVSLCMTCRLPWPVLYLLLDQRLINIRRDNTLYFTYEVDLHTLDTGREEADCAAVCTGLLTQLLDTSVKEEEQIRRLLEKKASRGRYRTFLDLYLEFRKRSAPKEGRKPLIRHKSRVFYGMAVLAVLLVVLSITAVVSWLVLGDIPIFRIFTGTFQKIGTEILGR